MRDWQLVLDWTFWSLNRVNKRIIYSDLIEPWLSNGHCGQILKQKAALILSKVAKKWLAPAVSIFWKIATIHLTKHFAFWKKCFTVLIPATGAWKRYFIDQVSVANYWQKRNNNLLSFTTFSGRAVIKLTHLTNEEKARGKLMQVSFEEQT